MIYVLTVAFYGLLALLRLAFHHWDITTFIVAGDRFVDVSRLVSPISVIHGSDGYDGQFYYRLALDPFTGSREAFGITLDDPVVRMQRIVYPLLAWGLSLGQPAIVPWALFGLNLGGLGAIAWLSSRIAIRVGAPIWSSALIALYPGFFITLVRDTTEIVATAFALAALLLALNRSMGKAAILASIAVLTRETTLFYLLGFGLIELFHAWRQRRISLDAVWCAAPLVVLIFWQYWLHAYWAQPWISGDAMALGLPFKGLVEFLAANLLGIIQASRIHFFLPLYFLVAGIFCIAVMAMAAISSRSVLPPAPLKIAYIAYAVLMVCLARREWNEPFDFLRAFADCYVISSIIVIASLGRSARFFTAGAALTWVPTVLFVLVF